MKAITLWQPWASLVALGEKRFETRSWATKYRGPIAIHAAKNYPLYAQTLAELDAQFLRSLGHEFGDDKFKKLPFGFVIAVAELVECWRIVEHPGTNVDIAKHIQVGAESLTNDKHAPDFADEQEMLFGDWAPGRYAWQLDNVHQLVTPIPAKGRQRIWNFDETPQGIRHGKQVLPGSEDAVSGLEVVV